MPKKRKLVSKGGDGLDAAFQLDDASLEFLRRSNSGLSSLVLDCFVAKEGERRMTLGQQQGERERDCAKFDDRNSNLESV